MDTDRKFLYSPGWGSDWSLRHSENIAKLYLFDENIIAYVEDGGKFTYDNCRPRRIVPEHYVGDDEIVIIDWSNVHPLLVALRDKILAVDPDEYPNFGGACDLQLGTCPDGVRFRITGYDGNESYIFETTEQRWF